MSIDISRHKRLRSERTLMCPSAAAVHARDRPSRYGAGGMRFFRCLARDRPSRYGCQGAFFCRAGDRPPRSLPHLGHPANPGHPASDAIDIKVLADLFCLLRLCSIDIKVFQTFASSSWPSCKSCPSCFRQLNACEGQALALRAAPGLCSAGAPAPARWRSGDRHLQGAPACVDGRRGF